MAADVQGDGPVPFTSIPTDPCRGRPMPIFRLVSLLILAIVAPPGSTGVRGQASPGPGPGRAAGAGAPGARQIPEEVNFANRLFRERRYDLAAESYERFLKGAKPGPDADDARFGLANARLSQGRYDQARRQFEEFLKAAPNHSNAATARYWVGTTAYLLGDLPAA